jgi:ABC-type transport system substrate-binding protein
MAPRTLSFDTFDAARAGDLSTLEVLGRTHSRLLEYASFDPPHLTGSLAASWEQPDETSVVLHVDPLARWHVRPPLDGRSVTSADVVASLRRAIEIARTETLPTAQRQEDWLSVSAVEEQGDGFVRLALERPDPFILQTLAGMFAFVQAPEAVEAFESLWPALATASVVGSGPFELTSNEQGVVSLAAFDGGHARPNSLGLEIWQPLDPVETLRAGEVHEVTVFDRRDARALAEEAGGEAARFERLAENPIVTTFFAGELPWSDLRLRKALWLALPASEVANRLSGGGEVPVPGVLATSAETLGLTDADVKGLQPDPGSAAAARALWEQGGGASLGTVTIDFPNVFEPRYSASGVVTSMLNATLGDQFRAAVEPYTTIARKTAEHAYGAGRAAFWFGWGPALTDPEPARRLFETYSSRGPSFAATGFASGEVDAALESLVDPASDGREELLRAATLAVAAELGGGILPWFTEVLSVFRRPFLDRAAPSPWWEQHLDRLLSVDTSHPDYT